MEEDKNSVTDIFEKCQKNSLVHESSAVALYKLMQITRKNFELHQYTSFEIS